MRIGMPQIPTEAGCPLPDRLWWRLCMACNAFDQTGVGDCNEKFQRFDISIGKIDRLHLIPRLLKKAIYLSLRRTANMKSSLFEQGIWEQNRNTT
jgi:hypothetical protein